MDSTNWGDGMASIRTFGGCHSIHLSYGRDALILQEYPHDGVIVWGCGGQRNGDGANSRTKCKPSVRKSARTAIAEA